jgi:hypothetical protein
MALPLMPARAGCQGGRRLACSGLLVVLALGAMTPPSRAEDADPFSATVAVDATADTVATARDMARTDGQRRALAAVAARLAGGSAPVKLPKLDDNAVTNLIASFEVANERMSAVRYVADYTFHFKPEDTRRVLASAVSAATAAAPAAAEPGKPVILLPVYQSGGQTTLWDDPNPWRQAWQQRPAAAGPARLLVPLGDAGDIAAIDADKALAGDGDALTAIARRNGGEEAIVALAAPRGPSDRPDGLDVTVRRYRAARLVDSHAEPLTADPSESGRALLRRAVTATVANIGNGWKNEVVAHDDQEGALTAVLPITGLDDWVRAKERLASVPQIRKIGLMALSRQEATIEIGYSGSIDQLKASLAEISLDLVRGDPLWRLARTGPAPRP